MLYSRGAEHVFGHSVADLLTECARIDAEFTPLKARAAPLDQFYVPTYPNNLPGGIPAEAFGRADATRALDMTSEVLALVKCRVP